MRWLVSVVLLVAATRSASADATAPSTQLHCNAGVPSQACTQVPPARTCKAGDAERIGEWRYAVIAPLYSATEDVTLGELQAMWQGQSKAKIQLAATAETQAAVSTLLGAGKPTTLAPDARPTIDDTHWAIVPAHELIPAWTVVSVDGKHPLDPAPNALAVPLCAPKKQGIARNIDPGKLTILAMTGTTAITRGMAKLINEKGVLYPLSSKPSIEPWFATADLVHISNEVSFVPNCNAGEEARTMDFCSKESYMELLEKSHTKIIEMTGSHLDDYGFKWIPYTLDMYAKRGWIWFGGGRDQHDAVTPKILEHHGNKLAFVGCNSVWTSERYVKKGPGPAICDWDRIRWQLGDLRRRGYVPIASIQHEEVYHYDPPAQLVYDLRKLAEAGAVFVLGSQAHSPHPWEMHYGAFLHYGPGNLYFDLGSEKVRDAAQDKLYIHAGKLLAVNRLYIRNEERGRPRILTDKERAWFLKNQLAAKKGLPGGADPFASPKPLPESRERPDSIVLGGVVQPIAITVPAKYVEGDSKKYAAVVYLAGEPAPRDDAFVVKLMPRKGKKPPHTSKKPVDLGAEISELLVARYPVDAAQIAIKK
ncbi:MAG TPA: CapA family protein [Kofleriaceae bacterium]|nr:CapA family protein [Kofleriaceae bacterium]